MPSSHPSDAHPLPRESDLEWSAPAYYTSAMQLSPGHGPSPYSNPEQGQQQQQAFVIERHQHPHHQHQQLSSSSSSSRDHFPSGQQAAYAMQFPTQHQQSTYIPINAHNNSDWISQQQQQQQLLQQQEDQLQGPDFVASQVQHHFATSQTPNSIMVAQQNFPSRFRSDQNLYSDVSDVNATQMLQELEQLQYQMQQSQAATNQAVTGAVYQVNSNSMQPQATFILPDSPQSYRTSTDSNYSTSAAQDGYIQGFGFYSTNDQNVLQPRQYTQVGLDMGPDALALDGGQTSPNSSLSDHGFVVHTPDSLMSFAGAFESTAITSNNNNNNSQTMTFPSANSSYTSQHSGPSITSASPHDIWQQPAASSEIAQADEPDDSGLLSASLDSSVANDEMHSSRDASIDSAPWPCSPEVARAVAPAGNHHRRRSSIAPTTMGHGVQKTIAKKSSVKKEAQAQKILAEKLEATKVGRRKGPLTSDQRRQAGEIRKLKACIRCKFLKKTCDPSSPCAGCRPSHARLWMVPCTRLDIRELHYFMEDWKIDYERHVRKGITVTNIIDYSPLEQQIFVGHGFGDFMSISVREVYVRDDDIFRVDWVETVGERPETYEQATPNLVIGRAGLSEKLLRDYLDRHVERTFERFVDQMFEGTKVWTELLLTIHTLYQKTRNPMLRTALKFFVAYNLTQHITYEENAQSDSVGTIGDIGSTHTGKTLAPVLLNYEIKIALANIWRDLHKALLADLSTLFSSVYNGQKQKNWAMIMMLSSILLMVWEEMQFDSHYRMEHSTNAVRFCHEMEAVPVGVITGLFAAISQKMPSLRDWDSSQHRVTFGGQDHEDELCEAVEKTKDILLKHEGYLKKREKAQFDECDFDSLCNKFVHKILLRPA